MAHYTIPLSEKLYWREKNPLQLFNKYKFIWSTDKEKWRAFSGLALHMTAIWEYCVFWLKHVVYDRWQERKSRAAGSSTDMQIAFSWLPYSPWYLSSGLQYAALFTDRKQLINSTTGGRKGSKAFSSARWKYKASSSQWAPGLPHQERQKPEIHTSQVYAKLMLVCGKISSTKKKAIKRGLYSLS